MENCVIALCMAMILLGINMKFGLNELEAEIEKLTYKIDKLQQLVLPLD